MILMKAYVHQLQNIYKLNDTLFIQSLLGNLLGWQILFDLFDDAVSLVEVIFLL